MACRARKEGIIEHYRERMERVTAVADTSRHAESRGIPAVCTALAGIPLRPDGIEPLDVHVAERTEQHAKRLSTNEKNGHGRRLL